MTKSKRAFEFRCAKCGIESGQIGYTQMKSGETLCAHCRPDNQPQEPEPTCSTCAYWSKDSCHRYPKLVYTASTHWCAEHKARKPAKKERPDAKES